MTKGKKQSRLRRQRREAHAQRAHHPALRQLRRPLRQARRPQARLHGAARKSPASVGLVYADLVIGRPGGACLLTLHWPNAEPVVGIPIPNKCAENVTAVCDRPYGELGPDPFAKPFPAILTDRGTEFPNPSRIGPSKDNVRGTRVVFCDPANSSQKSQLERVRGIPPKGVPFGALTQAYLALSA